MTELARLRAAHDRRQSVRLTLADLRQRVKDREIENAHLRHANERLRVENDALVAAATEQLEKIAKMLETE